MNMTEERVSELEERPTPTEIIQFDKYKEKKLEKN